MLEDFYRKGIYAFQTWRVAWSCWEHFCSHAWRENRNTLSNIVTTVTGRLDINTKSFRLKLIQSRCKWSHVLDLKNEEYITFLFTRKLYLKWLKFSFTFISWVRIETTYKRKRNDLFLVSCILTRPTGLPKYGVTRKNILRYDTLNRPIK